MSSAIDETKPEAGHALTADVRANFAAAKSEIEELQLDVAGAQSDATAAGSAAATAAAAAATAQSTANGKTSQAALAALATKATPLDADSVLGVDTADSNNLKRFTFTAIKAFLKTYFDTIYTTIGGAISGTTGTFTDGITAAPDTEYGADLSGNATRAPIIVRGLATPPSTHEEGALYYDSVQHLFYFWNGSSWTVFVQGPVQFPPPSIALDTAVPAIIGTMATVAGSTAAIGPPNVALDTAVPTFAKTFTSP